MSSTGWRQELEIVTGAREKKFQEPLAFGLRGSACRNTLCSQGVGSNVCVGGWGSDKWCVCVCVGSFKFLLL